ncbi:hypothetical protein LQW54_001504 [Pestalotiopsis sp. IQ-011]
MSCKDDTTGAVRSDHIEDAVTMDAAVQRALAEDDIDRELGIPAILRKYWRITLTCSVSFTAGLVFGYDVTVNGASISMPSFLLYFGDVNASGPYLPSLWTSSFLRAVSLARPRCTAAQFRRELAPLRLRAPIQTCLVAFIILTQAVALGVIRAFVPILDQSAFRFVFALQWAVGGLAVVSWACAPEGKTEAARNAMRRIYGNSDQTDDRLACLIHDIKLEETSQQDKGTYAACFRGSHFRRTMTIALLFSLTNVSGAAFLSQNIYFLITAGLEAIYAFDIGIGGFGLALLIIAVNGAYMHRCTRRSLILVGLTINFVFMVTIGALYWAPGEGELWTIAVLMNVLISLMTSTLQASAWPVAAEISSYHLRAKSISPGVFTQTITSWFFIFVTPYMYNVDTGNLGAKTGFIYAATTLLLGYVHSSLFLIPPG